jgi:hypothetical protein
MAVEEGGTRMHCPPTRGQGGLFVRVRRETKVPGLSAETVNEVELFWGSTGQCTALVARCCNSAWCRVVGTATAKGPRY